MKQIAKPPAKGGLPSYGLAHLQHEVLRLSDEMLGSALLHGNEPWKPIRAVLEEAFFSYEKAAVVKAMDALYERGLVISPTSVYMGLPAAFRNQEVAVGLIRLCDRVHMLPGLRTICLLYFERVAVLQFLAMARKAVPQIDGEMWQALLDSPTMDTLEHAVEYSREYGDALFREQAIAFWAGKKEAMKQRVMPLQSLWSNASFMEMKGYHDLPDWVAP